MTLHILHNTLIGLSGVNGLDTHTKWIALYLIIKTIVSSPAVYVLIHVIARLSRYLVTEIKEWEWEFF
jgi:hypothetical protein